MYSPSAYGGISFPSVEVAEVMRRYLESVASQGPVVRGGASPPSPAEVSACIFCVWRAVQGLAAKR